MEWMKKDDWLAETETPSKECFGIRVWVFLKNKQDTAIDLEATFTSEREFEFSEPWSDEYMNKHITHVMNIPKRPED